MIAAVIQARTGSSRLPGKILKEMAGKSVLAHVVERVKAARSVDQVVLAIPEGPVDDALYEHARTLVPLVHRGSESDVLARYHGAGLAAGADHIIRITSDCPLIDPENLDRMVTAYLASRPDYMSNTLVRHLPRGLDAEIFPFANLDRAFREAASPHEREHVTPYFYEHPEIFRLEAFREPVDLADHRWTLDTEEDWALISTIYAALHRPGEIIRRDDVLAFLAEHPEVADLNRHIEQKKLRG
jgi:spore coat polysaccharide biosynthesis protein SpsF